MDRTVCSGRPRNIAHRDRVSPPKLLAVNPQITDPDLIRLGDPIIVRPTPGLCADVSVRPSILVMLDLATKLGCFGAATLTFEAQVAVINADIDYVPFDDAIESCRSHFIATSISPLG